MDKILIVDDEIGVKESLKFSLKDKYEVILASSGGEALDIISKRHPNLVILDIMLPDIGGIDVLKSIRGKEENLPVIMLTAVSQINTAVESIKLGAAEYITKPFDVNDLKLTVEKILKTSRLEGQVLLLKEELSREYPVSRVIYRSKVMEKILQEASKVALTDSSVLLTGPTGVGKELIARFIHEKSGRNLEPFVPVHCAAIPESLFESELFGYEKGAFTNALKSQKGKIEYAGGGTIFLDEVSEIPAAMQVKLLRFLQEKEFSRLGSNDIIKSDARMVSASSKDLGSEIAVRNFRDDLFYRLSVIPIYIPPLKERREDVIPLVKFYFNLFKSQFLCKTENFSESAMHVLQDYDWPGNVRELKNIIERILVLKGNKVTIDSNDLPEGFCACRKEINWSSLKKQVEDFERSIIREVLSKTGYNQTSAARELKTTRRILRYKAAKYGIVENGERENTDN